MVTTRNECPVHGQPKYAHILACAHRGEREVWLADQGDGTCIVYEIRDIAAREQSYDALDAWIDSGAGGFDELERLTAQKRAIERTTKTPDHVSGRREFDSAVVRLIGDKVEQETASRDNGYYSP
jgi:hypothetical protein